MLITIQTSTSNMIPIVDIKYIYELARCSKCTIFLLHKESNKLYGATEDCTSIHEIDIPFLVNTDLLFSINQINFDELYSKECNYFIPDKFKWVMLPETYWDLYINNNIEEVYDESSDRYILYDLTMIPKQPIQDQIILHHKHLNFHRTEFLLQIEGFLNRKYTLKQPEIFYNVQNDEKFREVFDNKVGIGRVLCRMKNENIDVMFYIYKALIPMAKADTLDLEIRFDNYNTSIFMITFRPKKKKNPLRFNTYGVPFSEKIHCMFINMI